MRDREALHQLATRLVPHLGGGWTYPTDRNADKCGLHNYALLVRKDGLEIHLSEHRDRGKVSIGQAYTADAWVSKIGQKTNGTILNVCWINSKPAAR